MRAPSPRNAALWVRESGSDVRCVRVCASCPPVSFFDDQTWHAIEMNISPDGAGDQLQICQIVRLSALIVYNGVHICTKVLSKWCFLRKTNMTEKYRCHLETFYRYVHRCIQSMSPRPAAPSFRLPPPAHRSACPHVPCPPLSSPMSPCPLLCPPVLSHVPCRRSAHRIRHRHWSVQRPRGDSGLHAPR